MVFQKVAKILLCDIKGAINLVLKCGIRSIPLPTTLVAAEWIFHNMVLVHGWIRLHKNCNSTSGSSFYTLIIFLSRIHCQCCVSMLIFIFLNNYSISDICHTNFELDFIGIFCRCKNKLHICLIIFHYYDTVINVIKTTVYNLNSRFHIFKTFHVKL